MPVIAITVLLLVTLVGYLMSLGTQKSVSLGQSGSRMELTMQKLLRWEQTFIRTGMVADKERVNLSLSEMRSILESSRLLSTRGDVREIIADIEKENETHKKLFNALVEKVDILQSNNENMNKHFTQLQQLLIQKKNAKKAEDYGILGNINEYESEISMEGDELSLEYVNVREYIRQLTSFMQSAQLNAQNLLLRNDGQLYVVDRAALLTQRDEILRNARTQIQRLNSPSYSALWKGAEKELDALCGLLGRKAINEDDVGIQLQEATLYDAWKARQQLAERLEANSIEIQNLAKRLISQTQSAIEENSRLTNWINWCAVILAAIVMLFSGIMTSRSIIRPLLMVTRSAEDLAEGEINVQMTYDSRNELGRMAAAFRRMVQAQGAKVEAAQQIALGNLNVEVNPSSERDTLGNALAQMVERLNEVLGRVNDTATEVSQGASGIADASETLSIGATEQASSLEEMTRTMMEISSQTQTIAENASQANSMTIEASEAAETGHQEIQNMVDAMKEINESSREIGRIIKVIDEIAFQTNLLSLNAAVEAARAGSAGKGFAVVATEVRNLSSRSAQAASETATLIDLAISRVNNGVRIVDRTSNMLQNIVQEVTKASTLVDQIAISSADQAQRISQVNSGLQQLDGVTQQNATAAQISAEGSKTLSHQARELNQQLRNFNFQ